jgi:hypothetical protein
MKWKNAGLDILPADGKKVLISFEGIYYLTIFDEENGSFRLTENLEEHFDITENGVAIYWTEIEDPPHVRFSY